MPSESSAGSLPRLLYVASSPSQGGIERHSLRLAQQFQARGAALWFACRPDGFIEGQCNARGIPTVPFQVRNSGDFGAARQLAEHIRAHQIEIVHVHSRRDYVPAIRAAALVRRQKALLPRVLLHAHMIRPLGAPAGLSGRFFAWGAAGVIAVSHAVADFLRAAHHFPPEYVSVVHNGIEIEEFALPQTPRARQWRAELRQEWQIAPEAMVIGMVGRLDAKGQAALLAVAPKLLQVSPTLRFVLVGLEGLAGEQAQLQALADRGGIGDKVVFAGQRDDIPAVLSAFDILVHLPLDESFGLALAEAMAAGLPTVATNIGGCREVVHDGVSGLLVPPGSQTALREALRTLLNPVTGPVLRAGMGLAGREIAAAEFSLTRQVDRLESLYQNCVRDNKICR